MPFWITNPLHGVMPVYSSGDVEKHKAMGWTLLNHGESPNLPTKNPVVADNPAPDEPAHEERRKPGRPPKVK